MNRVRNSCPCFTALDTCLNPVLTAPKSDLNPLLLPIIHTLLKVQVVQHQEKIPPENPHTHQGSPLPLDTIIFEDSIQVIIILKEFQNASTRILNHYSSKHTLGPSLKLQRLLRVHTLLTVHII